jgi:thiamine-phosphate pyrophosphorylase
VIKFATPTLMMVTQPSHNLAWIVSEALSGGVTMVQWRQKTGVSQSGFNRAYAGICAVVQDAVPLVVNTVWETAEKLRVANVHLSEKSVAIATARKAVGMRAIVGKSVHTLDCAMQADADGADYLVAGTIFSSTSHADVEPIGLEFLTKICKAVSIPVFAIGGITVDKVASCISAGASGIAVLSPIMLSKTPAVVARTYRTALDSAWTDRG